MVLRHWTTVVGIKEVTAVWSRKNFRPSGWGGTKEEEKIEKTAYFMGSRLNAVFTGWFEHIQRA